MEWFDELAEFLRIPSISADPAHAPDVRTAADWVAAKIRRGGGEGEVVDWDGHPLAVGEIRASEGAGSAPTAAHPGTVTTTTPGALV